MTKIYKEPLFFGHNFSLLLKETHSIEAARQTSNKEMHPTRLCSTDDV